MLQLTTKAAMADAAMTLATSFELVQHNSTTFMPTDWRTNTPGPGAPENTIWVPMTRDAKRRMANDVSKILFANDSEITNFDLMLQQFSRRSEVSVDSMLIKTREGLRLLDESGKLSLPTGDFTPNVMQPILNDVQPAKDRVFEVISGWLDSDEEAHSLLYHLATALSPGWSAVKYVLLIGDGRNGKSVLLSMLTDLFGFENVSHVTRQQMAERLPVCVELNNKLLNIIFDGEMAYIKDSSMEKTLIAGEPGFVRKLYENGNTKVQSKALFLEALNSEPKTRDKSGALQKRLSRFFFPNVYPLDLAFERNMRRPQVLGAFLALLMDHFVQPHEVVARLKPTKRSLELQVDQQIINSPVLQYVQHLVGQDQNYIAKLEAGNLHLEPLIASFMAWRISEGHAEFSSADVAKMFREAFTCHRKSVRENGKVVKKEIILETKSEVQTLLDQLKGESDGLQ